MTSGKQQMSEEELHNISIPKRDLGDGVVDFQHHLLKNLQNNSKNLTERYNMLVDYCRDNMAAQTQVHTAALMLMQARTLEQLLELLSVDLLTVFDLDVVRVAMESDIAFDTSYGEENYSGFVFIPSGASDEIFTAQRSALLVGDTEANAPLVFSQIFADCEDLIASCALLRLELEAVDKSIILALGSRHKERYHAGQGVELLQFLASVVALQLDRYLDDLTI